MSRFVVKLPKRQKPPKRPADPRRATVGFQLLDPAYRGRIKWHPEARLLQLVERPQRSLA